MSSAVIQLLVLAGIAVFLILRLRNVLGTREGFEKPTIEPGAGRRSTDRPEFEVIEGGPDRDITDHIAEDSDGARALAEMKGADSAFSVGGFLEGAAGAYEMILMAFEQGDLSDVRGFLSDDVADALHQVIDARADQGLTVEASFVGLREIELVEATFDANTKEGDITVRFVGELTSTVKDSDGRIVEGDPNAIRRQKDVWTFSRVMGEDDPNWLLVATGG